MSILYNEDTHNKLRRLADELTGPYPKDWRWIGQGVSQRMSGITEAKARYYAAKHGGEASPMHHADGPAHRNAMRA